MRLNKRHLLAPTLLVLTLAAGCTEAPDPRPGGSSTQSSAPATASERPLPSDKELRAALLSVSTLGSEYTVMPDKLSPGANLGTSIEQCAQAGKVTGVKAQSSFAVGAQQPLTYLTEAITVASLAETKRVMKALPRVLKNCPKFGASGNGTDLVVRIEALSFHQIGEETIAFRLTGTTNQAGAVLYIHMVEVRVRWIRILISVLQFTSPDVGVTEKLVREAVATAEKAL